MEPLDFSALWDLIESRFTKHMHPRHIITIHRICTQRQNGILMDELPHFIKLLTLCTEHIENERFEFLAPIIDLLRVSLLPFITEKSFEKIECFEIIKQYFELISRLLSKKYTFITITICKGLQAYLCDVLDYKVINESGIIDELVDGIRSWCYGARWNIEHEHKEIKHKNPHVLNIELSIELIATIKLLSHSDKCAISLVDKSNILDLKILYDVQMNSIFLTHSIELLWNIIEQSSSESINTYIGSDYFNVFTALLTKYLNDDINKSEDKQLRNCILSILFILSKHEPMHQHFASSQIVNILLQYCELIVNKPQLNNSDEDFQLLCIVYSIIHRVCKSYRILSVLIHKGFIDHMTNALFVETRNTSCKWTPTQLINLRSHLLYIFHTFIEIVPKYFFKNKIISKLFAFFVSCHERKFVGVVSKALLRLFSKGLHILARKTHCNHKYDFSLSNEMIVDSLESVVESDNLCDILLQIINRVSFEQVTRTDAVLVISYLVKIDPFGTKHAKDVINCICSLLSTLPSLDYYHALQHAMIECLRNILDKRNTSNHAIFIEQKGIQMLINFIQKCHLSHVEHVICLLLHLQSIDAKQFIAEIKAYHDLQNKSNSDNNKRFQNILLHIWDKCCENDTNPTNRRVMRSVHCLYTQMRSAIYLPETTAMQKHKITKILTHSQLVQGEEWMRLEKQLKEEGVELTTVDSDELRLNLNKYKSVQNQLNFAERTLKIAQDKELEENLHDLMNKLTLYKSQQMPGKHSIKQQKGSIMASSIKLNKDQKDEIVAQSLQLNETMKKVLGQL